MRIFKLLALSVVPVIGAGACAMGEADVDSSALDNGFDTPTLSDRCPQTSFQLWETQNWHVDEINIGNAVFSPEQLTDVINDNPHDPGAILAQEFATGVNNAAVALELPDGVWNGLEAAGDWFASNDGLLAEKGESPPVIAIDLAEELHDQTNLAVTECFRGADYIADEADYYRYDTRDHGGFAALVARDRN